MLPEKCIPHTLICVLLFSFAHLVEPSPVVKPDLYQEGIAQRDSGNWQKALKIWLAAKDSTEESSKIDPRIGIAFIELVTRKQATDYYRQASDMYFWGFRQEDLKKHQKVVEEEIRRIAPLLTEKETKNWLKLLDKDDTKLNEKIKGFWIKKDPIPTSEINERLIEHWERIAHVKNKYAKKEANIYGTDDRGLVFVKYGA
ncbi:GWxTD domain-containing protein, partial [candidate division KSB1 bacterium]|nr:GWxTD domain-containing protein [candidate division KSB1 bacterium]NIS26264.1 GWxTD domain-containing protein [candidate division KSB1 bacterium]NIT73026.1 GWxTD domain-containing protein [candidate division KSB1 bacterium]NIU26913.1 GWxTD domain-containing protein [candidate division KSB1 bacterium]NIU89987.1 GWxTD domain-containing protein [candidate division KSB1 bacterium]